MLVGTASKENIPEVPMFSVNPAKRPARRTDAMADAITTVGQSIASVLQPVQPSTSAAHSQPNQVFGSVPHCKLSKIFNDVSFDQYCFATHQSHTTNRSEVLNQIKELFQLKDMGAITEDEYKEKKENIMRDL